MIKMTTVAALLTLFLIACAPETPLPEVAPAASTPPTATAPEPLTEPTDQQLLQQHPDYLDEALQDLEEVE